MLTALSPVRYLVGASQMFVEWMVGGMVETAGSSPSFLNQENSVLKNKGSGIPLLSSKHGSIAHTCVPLLQLFNSFKLQFL